MKDQITIPVFVMIRPRGGDFAYTDAEFQQMRDSVSHFKHTADGFVFSVLDTDGKVDIQRTTELVALADPLPCTFHRAFDQTVDLYEAVEDVTLCGISTIPTSGGAQSAIEGRRALAKLVQTTRGRIAIMVGGGVRSTNIEDLRISAQARFYHSSALMDNEKISSSTEIHQLKICCRLDMRSS